MGVSVEAAQGRTKLERHGTKPVFLNTPSPNPSQVDDMRFGQLFGFVNHYAQERHDELISIVMAILFKSRWQAR